MRSTSPWKSAHPLLIDLPTLRTLAGQRIFEVVVNAFTLHLRAGQWDQVVGELDAYGGLGERQGQSFCPVGLSRTPYESGDHAVRSQCERIRTVILAPTKKTWAGSILPFFGSRGALQSRCSPTIGSCRCSCTRKDTGSVSRACDSSRVLVAMLSAGVLTCKNTAEEIRRLMQWRYRFLVPAPEILFELAHKGAADSPPGDALLDVAFYLHDCMGDPGLHCGLEQSEPPLPMAVKLAAEWGNAITAFLPMVWRDNRFSRTPRRD